MHNKWYFPARSKPLELWSEPRQNTQVIYSLAELQNKVKNPSKNFADSLTPLTSACWQHSISDPWSWKTQHKHFETAKSESRAFYGQRFQKEIRH